MGQQGELMKFNKKIIYLICSYLFAYRELYRSDHSTVFLYNGSKDAESHKDVCFLMGKIPLPQNSHFWHLQEKHAKY